MQKTFKTIYYIALIAILFFASLLIVSVFPITGNIKVLSVLSGSMEPTIHTGSVVIIKPISDYKIGDVITFGKNTKTEIPTTHRIAEMKAVSGEIVYKTRGDANNSEDSKEVSQKEVLGKVYFSIPFLGYIVDFLKKPVGLMLVIVIPAVIIVYDEIQKIIKEIKKMREGKVALKKDENVTEQQ
ncbi:MAG: signal peptidase I [Candidatus Pacebacteria bacterium]|nr:signal peptidase I [Candidatus Paceibacterota bacterium]